MTGYLYIKGRWQAGDGASFNSVDPAKQTVIWQGMEATPAQVDLAVEAARGAFEDWANRPREDRAGILRAYQARLEAHRDELTLAISRDNGKPLWEAATEVTGLIGKVALSLASYSERTAQVDVQDAAGHRRLDHRPHGVIAVLGPFNFPAHLANGHMVPALLAGNTVVFKPSELTPLVGELMVLCWQEAGLPAGVLNLVQGGAEVGISLSRHVDIDGLFFTGSAETGRALHRQFAGQLGKILALELGGNNPLIVDSVADTQSAARLIVQSGFLTAGQRCTCARRLIIPRGTEGDAILHAVTRLLDRLIVGPCDADPAPFMGPVISNAAANRVTRAYDRLLGLGGGVVTPLERRDNASPFLTPAVVDMTAIAVPDEEIFGPVLQLYRPDDFAGAVALANNTRFGLAAGLISDDEERFVRFYQKARAGIVNWNRMLPGASSAAPFGGIGDSGNHRPSAYYAADYCAYPVASLIAERLDPVAMPIGIAQ